MKGQVTDIGHPVKHRRLVCKSEFCLAPLKHLFHNVLRVGCIRQCFNHQSCIENDKLLDDAVSNPSLQKLDSLLFVKLRKGLRKFLEFVSLDDQAYEIGRKDSTNR